MSKVSGDLIGDLIGGLIGIAIFIIWALIALAGAGGYVLNLIALYHAAAIGGPLTGIIVLRALGIVVPFVGSVLGFL